jgi:hypothetical protein
MTLQKKLERYLRINFLGLDPRLMKKSKRIPYIFKDESTGSCICLSQHIYMSHVNNVQPIRVNTIL